MVEHNIGGNAGNLAESFDRYLPNVQIDGIDHPDHFRWCGTLVKRDGRDLWRIRSNAEWTFNTPAAFKQTVFVTIPEMGALKVRDHRSEHIVRPGQAIVLHTPNERENFSLSDGGHARTSLKWSLGEAQWVLSSRFNEVSLDTLPPMPLIDFSNERGEVIRDLLSAIARDLASVQPSSALASQLMSEALLRLLFEPLLNGADHPASRVSPSIAPRAVKQAIDYMRANVGEPLRIRDVADACCVTPRTLENGFRDFKGTTPIAYLRWLRLEAVRRELLAIGSDVRISEIARRWGFVDMGRFAERYRRAYGELPSETVRKR
jgi:AraC-like DNA-binding protein